MDPLGRQPDVLVLGAGGTVGRAWMAGLLAGIEEATGWDFRECDHFVGTSAGSIVATALAAGHRPDAPPVASQDGAEQQVQAASVERILGTAGRSAATALRPAAGLLLRAGAPAGAVVRAAMLARAPRGRDALDGLAGEMRRLGVTFDGRLEIVCVDRATGRRTVFGQRGAPPAGVPEAVRASCSIPGVFSPVSIGGRDYVDGGVWSATNLDVAPAGRGQHVLCLNPTGRAGLFEASLASGMAWLSRSRVALEEQELRSRGATVVTMGPDRGAASRMGPNLMDLRRAGAGAEAGREQALRLA